MDGQLLAGHSNIILGLLSEQSLAKIKAAKMKAVAELLRGLTELSRRWDSETLSMAALERHDPAELMPLFERYAESQFDSYAEELLPHFSDAEVYARQLAEVSDRISSEIGPPETFQPVRHSSLDWPALVRLLKDSEPEQLAVLHNSRPGGDWEIYVKQCFERHLLRGALEHDESFSFLYLLFQMRYQYCLRFAVYWYPFAQRLRANLSTRLAHWEAHRQAYDRKLAVEFTADDKSGGAKARKAPGRHRGAVVERMASTISSPSAARRMEAYLESKGTGQTEFASRIGTTDRTLRKFRRTGKVRRDLFDAIADAMGTDRAGLLKPE